MSCYPKELENIAGKQSRLNSSTSLTLVSLFIGFPKSHSTWEPLVFAWHLICKRSGGFGDKRHQHSQRHKAAWGSCYIHPERSKPAVGFLSLRRTGWVVEWSQAERRERRLHPQRASGGQRACWPRWPPAPPVAGPTETTPARHLHLWRGKEIWKQLFKALGGSSWNSSVFLYFRSCMVEIF